MDIQAKLQQLQEFARKEQWEEMDALIPRVCNDAKVIAWSLQQGIYDTDGNIRDLAVSLLEKSGYQLTDEDKEKLYKLLENDSNIYVQFRSAFTLFNGGDRSEKVVAKMHEAEADVDVSEIAKEYLQNL